LKNIEKELINKDVEATIFRDPGSGFNYRIICDNRSITGA